MKASTAQEKSSYLLLSFLTTHQVVHYVVAPRHAAEHLAYKRLLLFARDVLVACRGWIAGGTWAVAEVGGIESQLAVLCACCAPNGISPKSTVPCGR